MIDDTILVNETPFYTYECEVDNVVDGDTIDVTIDVGFNTYITERVRARDIDTREIRFTNQESEEYSMGTKQARVLEEWVEEATRRGPSDTAPFVLLSEAFQRGTYARVVGDVYSKHHDEFWTRMMLDEFGESIRYRE